MLKGWLICIGLTVTALVAASCTPHTLAQQLLTGVALPAATQTADATTQAVENAAQSMARGNAAPQIPGYAGKRLVVVMPTYVFVQYPNGQQVVIMRKDVPPDRRD